MSDKNPKEMIRGFLEKDLGLDLSGIEDESPLFTSGAIDSFALLELMSFMEAEFNAKIDISDVSIEKLDSINALASLTE